LSDGFLLRLWADRGTAERRQRAVLWETSEFMAKIWQVKLAYFRAKPGKGKRFTDEILKIDGKILFSAMGIP